MRVRKLFLCEFTAIISLACLFILCAPQAYAQSSFTYPPFPTSAAAGLQVNGNATIVTPETGSNYLQLTPALTDQVGSAWYTNPAGQSEGSPSTLSLVNGFTTTFTLQFTGQGGLTGSNGVAGADGIAFVVQNGSFNGYQGDSTSGASAVGPSDELGGEIGFTGLTNSAAVQFDTWCNSEYGDTCATNDPYSSADQITVESCGAAANTVTHNTYCQFGTVDLSTLTTPIFLADGNVHTAQITYTPPPAGASFVVGACLAGEGNTPNSGGCGSITVTLDSQLVLTVPFNLGYINGYTDPTDSAYAGFTGATGGSWETQDILNWSFSTTVVQPFNESGPTTSNFSSNGVSDTTTIDTSPATGDLTCKVMGGTTTTTCGSITLVTTNNLIPNGDPSGTAPWSQYVVGSPWAPSVCAATPANGGSGNLCSRFVNACYGGATDTSASQADDFYCPYVTPGTTGLINLSDTFGQSASKLGVPNGTTVSFLDFTPSTPGEAWTPSSTTTNSVCTYLAGNTVGTPMDSSYPYTSATGGCDILDGLVDVFGDQTTSRGSVPKKGWIMTAFNVPMLLTSVLVKSASGCTAPYSPLNDSNPNDPNFENPNYAMNIWNNGNCLLDFVVNPAVVPNSISAGTNNSFQAAPPATFFWGMGAPVVQPNSIPPSGDSALIYNPSPSCTGAPGAPCAPLSWDTKVNTSLSTFGGDGRYIINWSASDVVGISERQIELISSGTCYNPEDLSPSFTPPCYNTSYFTTQVNVDSTPPTILAAFSTPGSPAGTFYVGEVVYPVYTCTDHLTNGVASGLATCAGTTVGTPGGATACPTTAVVQGPALTTSSAGSFSSPSEVTATDCAGNTSTPATPLNYTVAPTVYLQLNTLPLLTFNTAVPGGLLPLAYGAAITNLSAVAADDVTVTTTFSTPTKGVILGTPSATISTVSCSNSPCTLRGITITTTQCTVAWPNVICSVPSLAPLSTETGLWMEIIVPVSSKSAAGTFTSVTTVGSAGLDSNSVKSLPTETYTIK